MQRHHTVCLGQIFEFIKLVLILKTYLSGGLAPSSKPVQSWTNFSCLDKTWADFSTLVVAVCVPCFFETKLPNLKLKTWPKQLLGSLPLVIVLPSTILINTPGLAKLQFGGKLKNLTNPGINLKALLRFVNLPFCQTLLYL